MKLKYFACLLLVGLVGCGGSAEPKETGKAVDKASFQGDWALAVDSGVLNCENQAVSFTAPDGKIYALNGSGKVYSKKNNLGWIEVEPSNPIWLEDPEIKGAKVSISDMISAGLALCENK